MANNEVLHVEAEEMSIDIVINDALVKANVTDAIIAGLKSKYGSLTIAGQSDREGYDTVVEARKECKAWRVRAKKICEAGREKAVAEQKAWVAKEKDITGRIGETESYLEKLEADWENEKERLKQEKKRLQEESFIFRQQALTKMGAVYNGGNFELGEVGFDAILIKESDNDVWEQNILPKYQEQFEKIESERLDRERVQEEKDAAIAKEREELERQQRELKQKQEEFEKEKAEQARIERAKVEAAEIERVKQETELQNKRLRLLLQFNTSDIFPGTLWQLKEEEFNEILSKEKEQYEIRVADSKKKLEVAAAQRERERIEEEQRLAESKRKQEEQRKVDELTMANDKTKWAAFIKKVGSLTHSEMKSPKYKKMQSIAKEKLEEIVQL